MSDDVKDFDYYAAQAERQLRFSQGRDDNDQPLLMDGNTKTRYVMRADVYARLAAGAPKLQEGHQSSCHEAHSRYGTYHPEGHTERAQAKCVAGVQNTDNFQHSHTCDLTVFHTTKHVCVCGTEWS